MLTRNLQHQSGVVDLCHGLSHPVIKHHIESGWVLPVPGAPTRSTPAGERAPRSMNLLGFFRNSTSSLISSLTWSMPSMSLNVSFWSPLLIRSSFAPPKILRVCCSSHGMAKPGSPSALRSISAEHFSSAALGELHHAQGAQVQHRSIIAREDPESGDMIQTHYGESWLAGLTCRASS